MEHLSRILAKLHIPGPGPIQLQRIQEVAARVLGKGAEDIRVQSLRSGRLILEAPSAARSFEWGAFRTAELLTALQQIPGLEELQEIRFRVGSWRKNVHE